MLVPSIHTADDRGFTLLELMVVVAIISVLVLIVVGVYYSTTATTLRIVCESNLNSLRKSITIYSQSNGSYPPDLDALYPGYLASRSSLVCPATKQQYDYESGSGEIHCNYHNL